MPRLPKKKTQVLAEKKAYGETLGKLKAEEHFIKTQKGFWREIRETFKTMMKNVNPVDMIAVAGMTLMVKKAIDSSEDLRGKVKSLIEKGEWWRGFVGVIGFAIPMKPIEEKKYEGLFPDWMDWIIAFTIAYIIVKHGGALFGMFEKGTMTLTSVITALLG